MLPAANSLQQSQCNIGFSGEALTSGNKQRKIALKSPVQWDVVHIDGHRDCPAPFHKKRRKAHGMVHMQAQLCIFSLLDNASKYFLPNFFLSPIFDTLALFLDALASLKTMLDIN